MKPATANRLNPQPTVPRRLLFINQYYWPDHASTAQHLTDLAEHLAGQGFDVHVLCSRGSYQPGSERPRAKETNNGVQIHRVGSTSFGRKTTLHRMADYLSFYFRAFLAALTLPRPDVVVTLTTPPLIGLVGTILRRLKGSQHVFWSMDLHPDASLALGRMAATNPVVKLLAWISDAIYRRSDRVIVLGSYMADRIKAKGVRCDRLTTIPVWSRRDEIFPIARAEHPLRAALGLTDKFVVMYSGNLGLAHSFSEVIEAAHRFRERSEVVFLFVGGGPRLAEVRMARDGAGLTNIRLMDYFPRDQLHESLSVADVHLISMRAEMTGIVVPGKLYGAMASARPTIFIGPEHSESADTIRQAGCGEQINLGDATALVRAVERLIDKPALALELGRRGREAFLAHHEKEGCCRAWGSMLTDLLKNGPSTQPVTSSSLARSFRVKPVS